MDVIISLTKRRNEYGEYVVRVMESGIRKPDCYYHTDDYDDAMGTAYAMAKPYIKAGNKVTIKL